MGKFGFRSGYVKAQNIQSGSAVITTDGSGDGTQAVTFPKRFKSVPVVVLTAQADDTTGTLCAISVTKSGFTAQVDGSAVTSDDLAVGYVAMDYD